MTNIENAQVANQVATESKNNQAAKAKPEQKRVLKDTQSKVASTARRQPIAEGESAKREFKTDAQAKRVTATYSFKLSDGDKDRYQVESVFDFSTCSEDEILELAATTVRIAVQSKLRALREGALDPKAYAKVDVKKEIVETQRQSVDDFTKASRALGKLSAAEKARLKALLDAE